LELEQKWLNIVWDTGIGFLDSPALNKANSFWGKHDFENSAVISGVVKDFGLGSGLETLHIFTLELRVSKFEVRN
jgi:hypothetical protein